MNQMKRRCGGLGCEDISVASCLFGPGIKAGQVIKAIFRTLIKLFLITQKIGISKKY
jgi:hypothetical protein